MNKLLLGLFLFFPLMGFSKEYYFKVIDQEELNQVYNVNSDQIRCVVSKGGGTYSGSTVSHHNVYVKNPIPNKVNLKDLQIHDYFDKLLCEKLKMAADEGDVYIKFYGILRTHASDKIKGCEIRHQFTNHSYAVMYSSDTGVRFGLSYVYSPVKELIEGVSCSSVFE